MPVSPAILTGKIDSVKCPHCGQSSDFREIEEELSVGGMAGADRGHKVICDECDQPMEVVQIQKVTLVSVRQWPHPN